MTDLDELVAEEKRLRLLHAEALARLRAAKNGVVEGDIIMHDTYGHAMKQCPQCGCDTPELHEGYCEDCCRENQAALDQHNAAFDDWQRLTPEQRDARIKAAMR